MFPETNAPLFIFSFFSGRVPACHHKCVNCCLHASWCMTMETAPAPRQSFRSSSLSSVRQGGRLAGLEKQRDMAHFRMLVTYRNILTCGKLNSCSFFSVDCEKEAGFVGVGKKTSKASTGRTGADITPPDLPFRETMWCPYRWRSGSSTSLPMWNVARQHIQRTVLCKTDGLFHLLITSRKWWRVSVWYGEEGWRLQNTRKEEQLSCPRKRVFITLGDDYN